MNETKIKVTFSGEKNTSIPRIIFRCGSVLSHGAKVCWGVLKTYADENNEAYPSMKTIAEGMGIVRSGVNQYVRELESVGLVTIKKKTRVEGWGVFNVYDLTDTKLWWNELGELLWKDRKEKKKKSYKKQVAALRKYKDSTD
jgi:predicted transcriptional regulator